MTNQNKDDDNHVSPPQESSIITNNNNNNNNTTTSMVGTRRRTVPLHTTTGSSNTTGNTSTTTNTIMTPMTTAMDRLPMDDDDVTASALPATIRPPAPVTILSPPSRSNEAMKQLFCGGLAGSIAKTVTAPFSRLTILFQVHSLVTTKNHRPQFATNMYQGMIKIIERGGMISLWRGNMTSVLHRFPYSAINFYAYENTLDLLSSSSSPSSSSSSSKPSSSSSSSLSLPSQPQQRLCETIRQQDEQHETSHQLVRRLTKMVFVDPKSMDEYNDDDTTTASSLYTTNTTLMGDRHTIPPPPLHGIPIPTTLSSHHNTSGSNSSSSHTTSTSALHKFIAGAVAGVSAVTMCYPLDLVRTRLSTELEGFEHYRGITDAFIKIYQTEGLLGFYSGIVPTLLVAVPNFAISYTTYGTLKEYMIDDDLFYNLRRIDTESGEKSKLGFVLTVACGAASGIMATLITFPMDTIRRRMQVQNLHVPIEHRMTSVYQQLYHMIHHEGLKSLYRGLTPELIKVIPMVGTMFFVYERTKEFLNVHPERNHR